MSVDIVGKKNDLERSPIESTSRLSLFPQTFLSVFFLCSAILCMDYLLAGSSVLELLSEAGSMCILLEMKTGRNGVRKGVAEWIRKA